jgi:Gram-negative bacterial TonB protein C-terminal
MIPSKELALATSPEACDETSWIGKRALGTQPQAEHLLVPEKSWRLILPSGMPVPSKKEVLTPGLLVRFQQIATMFFACVGVAGTLTFVLLVLQAPSVARHKEPEKKPVSATDRLGPAGHPDLGLTVQSEGDRLLITWNREAGPVRNATQGVFTIDDGLSQRKIDLNAEQVANGAILYRQRSEDVSFRLEVANQEGTLGSGVLRVLGALTSERLSARADSLSPGPPPRPGVALGKTPAAADATAVVENQNRPVERAGVSEQTISMSIPTLPVSQPASRIQPRLETPPLVDGPAASATESIGSLLEVPKQAPMPGPIRETGVSNANATDIYSFPQPLREISPKLPNTALMSGQLIVANVLVHIDEKGRVTNAQFSTPPRDMMPLTMTAIVQAAKQWQFRPALLHGKAVASEFQIAFRIHPNR